MGKHKRDDRASSNSEESDSSQERHHAAKKAKKDKKEKKKEKKEKHKKHKKKHGKDKDTDRDREQERLLKEAKKFLKQKLKGGGSGAPAQPAAPPYDGPLQPISSDDYFTKNTEFAAWLRDSKGKFFSEQTTEENRAAFEEFVEAWNMRRLPAGLYTMGEESAGLGTRGGAGAAGAGATPRTSFNWGIKADGRAAGLASSGALGMAAALDDDLDLKAQAKAAAMAERQAQRREAKEWLDEAVPRLAGKDKQLEEKRARRELGKAGRGGGGSPEHVPRGLDVMGGGGDDSFAAAKAREAQRQQHRGRRQNVQAAGVQQRVAEAAAAEADKMAAFKALLAQGPIQIPKRL